MPTDQGSTVRRWRWTVAVLLAVHVLANGLALWLLEMPGGFRRLPLMSHELAIGFRFGSLFAATTLLAFWVVWGPWWYFARLTVTLALLSLPVLVFPRLLSESFTLELAIGHFAVFLMLQVTFALCRWACRWRLSGDQRQSSKNSGMEFPLWKFLVSGGLCAVWLAGCRWVGGVIWAERLIFSEKWLYQTVLPGHAFIFLITVCLTMPILFGALRADRMATLNWVIAMSVLLLLPLTRVEALLLNSYLAANGPFRIVIIVNVVCMLWMIATLIPLRYCGLRLRSATNRP